MHISFIMNLNSVKLCPTISLPTFRNVMFHPSAPHLDIHNMQIVKAFESIPWYFKYIL